MGQVKRIEVGDRLKLAKLIVALAHDDGCEACTHQIADLWAECGYRTKYGNKNIIADVARVNFDRVTGDVIDKYGGAHVMLENMQKIDPEIEQPGDFIMCMRASILIRTNAMVSF